MRIQIDVQGERQLGVALGSMADHIEDLTPYWDKVQAVFYKIEAQAFKTEGASGASGRWAQLKMPYADIKAREWGDLPILTRTGAFRDSLTSETGDSIVDKQKDSLTLGSSLPFAHYHQEGTPKGQMVARPPISLTQEQKYEMLRALTKQIKSDAKKAGFKTDQSEFGSGE